MTRLLVVCCFSLLLAGAFGANVTVSVMKGDDVTLSINPDDIKKAKLFWNFNNTQIATIDLEVKNSQAKYPDNERFTNRLYLDRNTGSLTINNIRTEDTGEYKLEIRSSVRKYKTFSVTVSDQAYTLTVIKGDPVTLSTGVKLQPRDVQLKFKGNIIPGLTDLTGELSIGNIKIDKSGEYEVEINARDFILRKRFRVNVSDEVESVSRTKDEFVILPTNTEIQSDDVIEWKFKNTSIAQFNRTANKYSYPDAKWSNRLQMGISESLIIMKLKTEDSGLYDVIIKNSKNFVHRRFNLTVTGADVTVMNGDLVTLLINRDEIKEAECLLWKFENTYIATIDLEVENSQAEYPDDRFKGRLNLDRNNGSLTINNIRTEDKGVYKLEIRNSKKPKYKTFSVTVSEFNSRSHQVKIGPGLFVEVIMMVIVLVTFTGDD